MSSFKPDLQDGSCKPYRSPPPNTYRAEQVTSNESQLAMLIKAVRKLREKVAILEANDLKKRQIPSLQTRLSVIEQKFAVGERQQLAQQRILKDLEEKITTIRHEIAHDNAKMVTKDIGETLLEVLDKIGDDDRSHARVFPAWKAVFSLIEKMPNI